MCQASNAGVFEISSQRGFAYSSPPSTRNLEPLNDRPMKTDELREKFLAFFETKGCVRRASDVLIPRDDKTVLFTPAGMNQFKNQFLGIGPIDFTLLHRSSAPLCTFAPPLAALSIQPSIQSSTLPSTQSSFFHTHASALDFSSA